jgi:hypothetical protein
MSTYTHLLELLADGEWHDRGEIAEITRYPDDWLAELAHEGHLVVHEDGTVKVRARAEPREPLVAAS